MISELIEFLGEENVLKGSALTNRYSHIWKMNEPLDASVVVLPKSTNDLSAILKICSKYNQPVVVHGGLTNLVGSTETKSDDLVISMEKMNRIEEVDEKSRTTTVQAGVILENLQVAVAEKDLLFPLNFGAKGSAQFGGIISTNAGGLRVFKYGMTRNLVLGLEVVQADGTIIDSMKKIIKDNSAYDLKQMFIGSEGTLGVISRAVLKLVEAPKSRCSAFVAFNDYEKVVSFLKYMDSGLAGNLSAYELIWRTSYELMTGDHTQLSAPLPYDYNYYVLLESLGSNHEYDQSHFQSLLEQAMEKEIILDAAIAYTESDLNWFWKIREDVHVISSACNFDQHFDISLPIPHIGSVIDQIVKQLLKLETVEKVFCFGHVADGNIHLVVGKTRNSQDVIDSINDVIYSPLKSLGGSISAEHGIGLHKKRYLHLCRTNEEIELMRSLKKLMDPKNILNRGKVV